METEHVIIEIILIIILGIMSSIIYNITNNYGCSEDIKNLILSQSQKLDQIMSELTILRDKAAALETKVDEFQTALDKEQEQVNAVLQANVEAKAEIESLKTQLAEALANADPAVVAEINASLDRADSKLITSKADLESTIADEVTEEPPTTGEGTPPTETEEQPTNN